MRATRCILLAFVAACGGSSSMTPDGAGPVDAEPDAAPDAPDLDSAPDAFVCVPAPAWVAFIVRGPDSVDDLYAVRVDETTAGPVMPANPTLPTDRRLYGYGWAQDGSRLFYVADPDVRTRRELFSVAVGETELGPAQKVNGYLPENVSVMDFWASPTGDHVVYRSDRLYAVDLSGAAPADPIQVTPEPTTYGEYVVGDPTWAPTGHYLAYAWLDVDGNVQVMVADQAGGPLLVANGPAPSGGGPGVPAWRPFGTTLTFVARVGQNDSHVEIVPVTGGVPGSRDVVTGTADWVSSFKWSPDGNHLAIVGVQYVPPDSQRMHIFVVDVGAPPYEARLVTGTTNLGSETTLDWSPDSRVLLYNATVDGNRRLFAVLADGSEGPAEVTAFTNPDCAYFTTRGWSPTLAQAWYLASDCDGLDLYVADVRGWPPVPGRRVSAAFPAGLVRDVVSWAPDGRTLVYIADQEVTNKNEAYVVAFDDGIPRAPVKLHPPLAPFDPGWGDVREVSYGLDSRRVLYAADQYVATRTEALVVEVDDGTPATPQAVSGTLLPTSFVMQTSWQPAHGCGL